MFKVHLCTKPAYQTEHSVKTGVFVFILLLAADGIIFFGLPTTKAPQYEQSALFDMQVLCIDEHWTCGN